MYSQSGLLGDRDAGIRFVASMVKSQSVLIASVQVNFLVVMVSTKLVVAQNMQIKQQQKLQKKMQQEKD